MSESSSGGDGGNKKNAAEPKSRSESLLRALSLLIKQRRETQGISQTDLAARAGLHRTYVSNIEKGAQNISIDILCRIAEALSSGVTELISEAELLSKKSRKPLLLMLVEDNPADVFLFKRSLTNLEFPVDLNVFTTGDQAFEFLKSENSNRDKNQNRLPELIFLDLNLPNMSGHELLRELKRREDLRIIPVIVLTTSSRNDDIEKTYSEFANSYLTKPVDPREFEDSVTRVLRYWMETSILPSRGRGN